mmetsp:Transcript_11118/g.28138  ORF Transcript_11118/g.28138 Transcript_11118/m.28138 type:complete len:237 (+) Transcript_11118:419-1129(+)
MDEIQKTPAREPTPIRRKSAPPTIFNTFSDRYFDTMAPPTMAMSVAAKWPPMEPKATPTGLWEATRATVAIIDRSPHSAAKMIRKVDTTMLSSVSSLTPSLASSSLASSSSSSTFPLASENPLRSDCTPKKKRSATDRYSVTGKLLWKKLGSFWKMRPMPTEMTLISDSAAIVPASTRALLFCAASRAARKKVLSPISDTKIRLKAAVNPLLEARAFSAGIFHTARDSAVTSAPTL